MLIEIDKYQANTLRRGKVEALEQDISNAYAIFTARFENPTRITMK